jgi:hypothetical protein
MGTFQDIRSAIETRFSTNYTDTAISWDNVAYDPSPETSFVRLIINEVDSFQVSMSTTPCHRFTGIIHVLIMVPVGTGTDTARGYADTVANIFRNACFDNINCRTPRIVRVGDVGEYFQYSCLINFWKDEALSNAS